MSDIPCNTSLPRIQGVEDNPVMERNARETIEAVWRIESAALIARLARIVRDVGLAEELAHDAFVAALEQWPVDGIPRNPAAWLMGTAKHRAIDLIRRERMSRRKVEEIARELPLPGTEELSELDDKLDDNVGDDLLRLMFMTCHPVLSPEARSALTLRLLGGLSTVEIARAYLIPEPTVAQRIVRAKRTLSGQEVPLENPHGAELTSRLASVLEVVYLMFNEGYTATSGDQWMRPALCEEALRLGRILSNIAAEVSEVHGLVALMELQASRFKSRVGPQGEPILLMDQDRSLWDQLLIHRGLASLERALQLQQSWEPYALQAAIAACHARAATPEQTDWHAIAALYGVLMIRTPSPIVQLNRSVAVAMAFGPAAGLKLIDELLAEPALQRYHLLPCVRGDLLEKLGRFREAALEFQRSADLATNLRERELMLARAESLATR